MHIALVANSRSGSAPDPEELERRLTADGATVHTTDISELDRGEASADRLAAGGAPDRVAVAGGDGSIGLVALAATRLGVPLAVVPVGTANDFARATGLPRKLEDACLLARDPDAARRLSELALAGERPFVNAAAGGLAVQAARAADALKGRLGALAYGVGALTAAARATPLACRVRCDGIDGWTGDAWQVTVGVTGAFGGGSGIGGTRNDDGLLDAAVVPAGSRLGLARRALGMRAGRLTAQDDVGHLQGSELEVDLEGVEEFNVDGELCTLAPARFTLYPGGFVLLVPRPG